MKVTIYANSGITTSPSVMHTAFYGDLVIDGADPTTIVYTYGKTHRLAKTIEIITIDIPDDLIVGVAGDYIPGAIYKDEPVIKAPKTSWQYILSDILCTYNNKPCLMWSDGLKNKKIMLKILKK